MEASKPKTQGINVVLTGKLLRSNGEWIITPDIGVKDILISEKTSLGSVEEDPNNYGNLIIPRSYPISANKIDDQFLTEGRRIAYTPVALTDTTSRAVAISDIESFEKVLKIIETRPNHQIPEICLIDEDYDDYNTIRTKVWSGYDYMEKLNAGTFPASILSAANRTELVLGHKNIPLPHPHSWHPLYREY